MSALRARPPTGAVPFPLILIEGQEKSGKTYAALSLSSSDKVRDTYVVDLGEGTADEYARLGRYQVLDHNGTFTDLMGQVDAVCSLKQGDKPDVLVIDSATLLWDLLKDWTTHRARGSKKAREQLAKDPDADIDVSMNYWNDAKDRWYQVVNTLRTWPGIGIMVARGKEVAKVQGGQPVAGQTEYRVEAEKGLGYAVSAWVRMERCKATLVAVRSLDVALPRNGLDLPAAMPLEHLVFGVLGAGGFTQGGLTLPAVGLDRKQAKERVKAEAVSHGASDPSAVAAAAWEKFGLDGQAEYTGEDLAPALDCVRAMVADLAKRAS